MMKKAFGLKKSKDTAPPASSSLEEPRRGQEFKALDEFEILETLGMSRGAVGRSFLSFLLPWFVRIFS